MLSCKELRKYTTCRPIGVFLSQLTDRIFTVVRGLIVSLAAPYAVLRFPILPCYRFVYSSMVLGSAWFRLVSLYSERLSYEVR